MKHIHACTLLLISVFHTSCGQNQTKGKIIIPPGLSSGRNGNLGWTLPCLTDSHCGMKRPTVADITNKPVVFGMLKDDKGNIWFGTFDGVKRLKNNVPLLSMGDHVCTRS